MPTPKHIYGLSTRAFHALETAELIEAGKINMQGLREAINSGAMKRIRRYGPTTENELLKFLAANETKCPHCGRPND
jgi:hypothetical protein